MIRDWSKQTVYITGGASGMGRAVARQISRAGARVGLCDRNVELAEKTAQEIQAAGGVAAAAVADVRVAAELGSAFGQLESALGPPSGVLACAGITGTTLLDNLTVDRDLLLVEINLLGVANTLHVALPSLRRQGGGWFAGVSSLVAMRGFPFTAAYCGSKSGIATYLDSLRHWLKQEQIELTVIYPGYVRTPLTEQGAVKPKVRLLEPEQAANYIVQGIAAGRPVCQFPPIQAWGMRSLRWWPVKLFDKLMVGYAKGSPHLKY